MESIDIPRARRLALARAGLLGHRLTGMPQRARGKGARARRAALAIVDTFGYLQLDTVSIAGARSHALVLLSRLEGFDPSLGEELLQPGEPLFEYWGHEACWIPMALYPTFEFRRQSCRTHPWWGDLIGQNSEMADGLLERLHREGPLRSQDLEGSGGRGWWDLKLAKKVMNALWSRGDVAIRERKNFQRIYDLRERVIPESIRQRSKTRIDSLKTLLMKALEGHGWATTGTLAATWRLRNRGQGIHQALQELQEEKKVVPCALTLPEGKIKKGWIRPSDLDLTANLMRLRPRQDQGVLLSPFDPLLWDRQRVATLFDFEQKLEIFKPEKDRKYGYFCLPVLAGERLVARVDLKANKKEGKLNILSLHPEPQHASTAADQATQLALERHAGALGLAIHT